MWQQIKTAPKDGTPIIIAYRAGFKGTPRVTEAYLTGNDTRRHPRWRLGNGGEIYPDSPDILGWCPMPTWLPEYPLPSDSKETGDG